MLKQTRSLAVVAAGFLLVSTALPAAQPDGHRFGEWPAINAMIHGHRQKNLNLDDKDFLIEVWFKPLPMLPDKPRHAPNCLVCKKACEAVAGYDLSYGDDGSITLTLCDKAMELDRDLGLTAPQAINMDGWNYLAVACRHKDRKVVFYLGGKPLKEFGDVKIGDMSNHDMLSVGYCEYVYNGQAHCQISQARVWRFPKGLPGDLDKAVASHNDSPAKPAESLAADAEYSAWAFISANDNIKDSGNNGNELCYAPWGYKPGESLKEFPEKIQGATYYVDPANPAAGDANPGTKEKPFKTIHAGAKAAMPGDLVHLAAGLYRETIHLRCGENGKPVTIEGEDGTVISGDEPVTGWRKVEGGLWVIQEWRGHYSGPFDDKTTDARSQPANLLFVDGRPMDFIRNKSELTPGSWTIEPVEGVGHKTLTVCPLPGVDPTKAATEMSETLAPALLITAKFNHVRNIHFTRGPVGLRGMCNRLENCVIDWSAWNGLSYGTSDNVIRGNKILWCGLTGFGGSGGTRITFEKNLMSYCSWRPFDLGWHGGAIKIIPSCTDFVTRDNEICYNDVAGLWYDTNNQGNLNEGNLLHDNFGPGGFDEYSYCNTWRYNLSYNNTGCGIGVCNSSGDTLYRNILFNNGYGAVQFRVNSMGAHNPPEVRKSEYRKWMLKFDVRNYHGMNPYEREKRFRETVDKYVCDFDGDGNLQNTVTENVMINAGALFGSTLPYDGKRKFSPDIENTLDNNYYWSDTPRHMIGCGGDIDLATWQRVSGQDKASRFIDPWAQRDRMPDWFKERFHFAKDQFRPADQTWETYISGKVRRSIAQIVLYSRLLRAKTIELAQFTDPNLNGYYFDLEGKGALAFWSKGPTVKDFLAADGVRLVQENKFLQRRAVEAAGGRFRLFLNEDPLTLIGVEGKISEDPSVVVELPLRSPSDKPVEGAIVLTNPDKERREYDLEVAVGKDWRITPAKITKTLDAGQQVRVGLKLEPPRELTQGVLQLNVTGSVGGRDVAASRVFGIGEAKVIPARDRHLSIDGDLAEWQGLTPTGVADKAEQVVSGRENWKGPDDLSAKVWLMWQDYRELYFAADVTDDQIVTHHRAGDPTKSDSVELLVDARPPWKQYMNPYTPGTFRVILVPANGKEPMTAKFVGPPLGEIVKMGSKKTPHGYTVTMQIHFHTNQIEAPGWSANREIRVGVLVHDSDDPTAKECKCTIGLWRTAADAAANCASLTSMMLQK